MQNVCKCSNINNENNNTIKDNNHNDKLITNILSVRDGNKSPLSQVNVKNVCILCYFHHTTRR